MSSACVLIAAFLFALSSAHARADEQEDPSSACFAAMDNKPELMILRDKIAVGDVRTQTLDMLASNKRPSKAERTALAAWVTATDQCAQSGSDWRQAKYPAQINSLIAQYFSATKLLAADLYGGKATYGDFAKARASAYSKLNSDIMETVQRLVAERKAEMEKQEQLAREEQRRKELESRVEQQRQDELRQQQEAHRLAVEQQNAQLRAQEQQARRNAALMILLNRPPVQPVQPIQIDPRPLMVPVPRSTNTDCNPNGAGGFNCTTR